MGQLRAAGCARASSSRSGVPTSSHNPRERETRSSRRAIAASSHGFSGRRPGREARERSRVEARRRPRTSSSGAAADTKPAASSPKSPCAWCARIRHEHERLHARRRDQDAKIEVGEHVGVHEHERLERRAAATRARCRRRSRAAARPPRCTQSTRRSGSPSPKCSRICVPRYDRLMTISSMPLAASRAT